MKLEKAAKKFEGARSPYMLSTGKKAWYRKEGTKWKYDSMVTPAEEKEWEEAWAKKKKLKEMKAKTAAKESKLQAQVKQLQQQQAAQKASGGPSKQAIEAAGTRTKLYYDQNTSDRARKLCDMTGILCLDKTAEDYVEGNLQTIFELSTEQKKEVRGMNPLYPLDTDGRFSEDPLFMEETLAALKKYKKEVFNTGKWKEAARAKFIESYTTIAGNTRADAEGQADYILTKEEEYMKAALDEWIDAIERHENDKLLMAKMRTVEQSVTGARVVHQVPQILTDSIVEKIIDPSASRAYAQPSWSSLTPEGRTILETLGMTEMIWAARTGYTEDRELKALLFCALHPDLVDSLLPYFEGATVGNKPTFDPTTGKPTGTTSEWVPGGANVQTPQSYRTKIGDVYSRGDKGFWKYEDFKKGAEKLRKIYKLQAELAKKIVHIEKPGVVPEYEWTERPGQSYYSDEGTIHDRLSHFLTGESSKYNGASGMKAAFKDLSWGELADATKNMRRVVTVGSPQDEILRSVQDTSKFLGDTTLSNTAEKVHTMMDGYYKNLSTPMKEQILYSKDLVDNAFDNPVGSSFYQHRLEYRLPDTGFMGYKVVRRHPEYGVAYSSGRGRGRYRRTFRNAEVEKFGENVQLKNSLKQKFFMRFSTSAGQYSRSRRSHGDGIIHPEAHPGASILTAIGVNWQVRKLAKKAQAVPDWRWGDAIPYGKNNPFPVWGDFHNIKRSDLDKAKFDKLITDARNTSIAANIGLIKKELKASVQTGIAKPQIVLRTNVDGVTAWQTKVDNEWTHFNTDPNARTYFPLGSMKVKAVFDIMYHPYYDKYKAAERSRGNVQYAWHGTDFESGSKIIKGGYFVPVKHKTGRMLGNGTYVSSSSSKVGGYFMRGSWGRGGHGVMFWSRIAMGNVNNRGTGAIGGGIDGSQPSSTGADRTVHTIYMPGGVQWDHDEHCILSPVGQYNFNMIPIQWVDVGPAK